ncbi:carbohydrate ABC transporter permease [Sedimentisphaera salicampi]|uniref:carbohydrate ABC transporter permease n=1 Tax=Sedimentisphaera salicampi TaxID=1941349 RepID=UPI000B9C1B7E|nr:sugar ABC transporter permease [Sedimentisphaera salicampi]OXU15732.1 sn-glycerol-3-phosphate transport system permease protein UgpA [Sedimentisphaera salicampi]
MKALYGSKRKALTLFALLVTPVLLLRLATAAYPICRTIWLSMTDTHLFDSEHSFVGMENFRLLFTDPAFLMILSFSIVFIIISTILELVFGLLIASLLNCSFKGRFLARTINLIPWVIPTIVAAYAFQWLLDEQFGMFSHWISDIFDVSPAVLNTALGARITLILVNVWKNSSFMAIIFLAGLQGVPEEFYEAARVDGAGPVRRFFTITLPMLMPLMITMGMYFLIWQLANFDLVYGLTRGGPGIATTILPLNVYHEGLIFFKFGYGSAVSVILMLIVSALGLFGMLQFKKWSY